MDLHDGNERCIKIVRFRLFSVEDLNRVGATGNSEDRTLEEVLGELFSVESCGCNDNLQVWSSLYSL